MERMMTDVVEIMAKAYADSVCDVGHKEAQRAVLRALASSQMPAMIRKPDGTLILSQDAMDDFKRTCSYLADGEIIE
jgi:hypothetical protein